MQLGVAALYVSVRVRVRLRLRLRLRPRVRVRARVLAVLLHGVCHRVAPAAGRPTPWLGVGVTLNPNPQFEP